MLKLSKTLMKLILVREEKLCIKKINSMELLEGVKKSLDIKAKAKNIDVIINGPELSIEGDEELLQQLFINLLDNAIKASNLDGRVILGTEYINEKKAVYIKDFGVGMDKEELNKITEPFYRVDKSRSRKEGGVGLGLTICKEIVQRHGVAMEIDSKLNVGTEVRVFCMTGFQK